MSSNFIKNVNLVSESGYSRIEKNAKPNNAVVYLPWARAWALFKEEYPEGRYHVETFGENHLPFLSLGEMGTMVAVSISLDGQTFEEPVSLAVMDYRNQPVENPMITDINNAIMRCLTKAIAIQSGIGLKAWLEDGKFVEKAMDGCEVPEEKLKELSERISKSSYTEERALALLSQQSGIRVTSISQCNSQMVSFIENLLKKEEEAKAAKPASAKTAKKPESTPAPDAANYENLKAPKEAASKADAKAESPKHATAPKAETPKTAAPKTEVPKVEAVKATEAPKTEATDKAETKTAPEKAEIPAPEKAKAVAAPKAASVKEEAVPVPEDEKTKLLKTVKELINKGKYPVGSYIAWLKTKGQAMGTEKSLEDLTKNQLRLIYDQFQAA